MKIVAITQYYPPHVGGLEVVAMKQAESHVSAGDTVTVVTCSVQGAAAGTSIEGGVTVQRAPAWNILDRRFGLPFAFIGWRLFRRIGSEIKSGDLVELHDVFYPTSWAGWFWARKFRKPLVLVQHVGLVEHPSLPIRLIQRLVYGTVGKKIFDFSAKIVVFNPNVKQFLRGRGVSEAKVVQLRNGIEVERFRPLGLPDRQKIRAKYGLPKDRPLALFIGRLVPKKGADVLLKARCESFDLVFVGSGDISPKMAGTANAHFLGPLPRNGVAEICQASDIFVLPALGEVFTLAMQEAMACGLPVVTTNDPGYAEYDLDRNLISFAEPEPAELNDSILAILNKDGLSANMGRYSRALAEKWFDWDANFASFEIICREAAGVNSDHLPKVTHR